MEGYERDEGGGAGSKGEIGMDNGGVQKSRETGRNTELSAQPLAR